MRYDDYRYLFPPRPDKLIAPAHLAELEQRGWLAQAKLNGTCCTLYVPPATSGPQGRWPSASFARGRHGPADEIIWQPGERWEAFAAQLTSQSWHVFVGELLHSKVSGGPRDTIALHDILVADGEYLIGKSYQDRYRRLARICLNVEPDPWLELSHRVIVPGVWLINNYYHDFAAWYDAPPVAFVEGLVMKDPNALLQPCGRPTSNSSGQVKCRYPTANKSF